MVNTTIKNIPITFNIPKHHQSLPQFRCQSVKNTDRYETKLKSMNEAQNSKSKICIRNKYHPCLFNVDF